MPDDRRTIAFIGGTGPEGLGLALRFASTGHDVIIGSRRQERADEAVGKVRQKLPNAKARGMENEAAVRAADIVMVTVPYAGQKDTLRQLRQAIGGKLVVDTVVPVEFVNGKPRAVAVPEGSAAQEAQALLPDARVVAAFQNLSARELMDLQRDVPSDVVVCADDAEAKRAVIALAAKVPGVRGIDGGGLENSRYVEQITVLLLNINRVYKSHSMIKIVGV